MKLNYEISGVISHLNGIKEKTNRTIFGKKLILLLKVFDPEFIDSKILANCIKELDGKFENVLDLGTGCGIQTIFIADKANKIIASDINPYALKNAKLNINLYGLENKVQIIKSDLFSNIKDKFDLIIFNPPFFSEKPKDIVEKSVLDYKHNILKKFFRKARSHLNTNGKIILIISEEIGVDFFNKLITKNGFKFKIIEYKKTKSSGDYLVYIIN